MNAEMDCMVVTQKEFQILAVLEGMERFCGFDLKEKVPETREELWPLLLEMAQKDEIHVREEETSKNGDMDSFELAPYLRGAFAVLKSCKRMLVIYSGREDCPSKCIYAADWGGTAVLQNSAVNQAELKVYYFDQMESLNLVLDSIKETGHTLPEERDCADEEVLLFDDNFADAGALCKIQDVLLVIDIISIATAQPEGRCILIEEGIYPIIIIQKQGEQRKEYLSKQGIQEFLGGNFS